MSRLEQLYQQLILDHHKSPLHFGEADPVTHDAVGNNPLCGDAYRVTLTVVGDRLEQVKFSGTGCAISKASGSLMTGALTGLSVSDALSLKDRFLAFLSSDGESDGLGKLSALGGVRQFPARVKCATLVWRAFEAAIEAGGHPVSTE
ncbi:SUF system NifU family Fe-S cluster assembly protein [bacterium]|nr:SUF system NifU family Fe-S cluster assembly protein [bacterium]